MGKMVIAEALAAPGRFELAAACDAPGSRVVGHRVAPGVEVVDRVVAALAAAEVYVDFTVPEATRLAARAARGTETPAVVGTTGMDADTEAALDALAEVAPIVVAPNFSLGVNLLLVLAEEAARVLGEDFDLEVVEAHHRGKRDAPSGTALALARALAAGRGWDYEAVKRHARDGEIGPRPRTEIGVATVRGGDVAGDHTAHFLGPHERLELTHRAGDRSIFARGALRAAAWVVGKPAGRYSMRDVLGLGA
jgi:4-hydroxy-tetrahydrodipicolinate reductase